MYQAFRGQNNDVFSEALTVYMKKILQDLSEPLPSATYSLLDLKLCPDDARSLQPIDATDPEPVWMHSWS